MSADKYQIPEDLSIGAVKLRVRDLKQMLGFYHGFLGLELLVSHDDSAVLGYDSIQPLLVLEQHAQALARPANAAGLYHFAFLTPGRENLAHALHRLLRDNYPLQGVADHFVSEAIYLADPEGNGIEIYADRPRETWKWEGGKVRIGTVALDIDSLLAIQGGNENRAPVLSPGTKIGHIHLQVVNLLEAMRFYGDILGFDSMGMYGQSAAFYSAGGYHHHIGLNTWASAGGPRNGIDMQGMESFEIVFPDKIALDALTAVLSENRVAFGRDGGIVNLVDPSGISIKIREAGVVQSA